MGGGVCIVSTRHQEPEARIRERHTNFPETLACPCCVPQTQQNRQIAQQPLRCLQHSSEALPFGASSFCQFSSHHCTVFLHASKNKFSRWSHAPTRKGSAPCIVSAQAQTLAGTFALLLGIVDLPQHLQPGTRRAVTSWFVIYVSLSPDMAW